MSVKPAEISYLLQQMDKTKIVLPLKEGSLKNDDLVFIKMKTGIEYFGRITRVSGIGIPITIPLIKLLVISDKPEHEYLSCKGEQLDIFVGTINSIVKLTSDGVLNEVCKFLGGKK